MAEDRKKFRDTKMGVWLKEKAPKILDTVGDLLPDQGVLGIVKNLVTSDPEIPLETQIEFHKLQQEYEIELLKDVQNARSREVEFIKATGHIDWMQTVVGILVMVTFIGVLLMIGYKKIPQGSEHLMINAIGIMEGLVLCVVGYYFGSSASSRIKDMRGK